MSKITDFFAKQPYKYATLRMLHTEWFDIKKPEMIRELNTLFDGTPLGIKCE